MNHSTTKPNLIVLILALAATLFILWRVLIIGMSEYYVDKAINGDAGAIRSALSWNANHPKAQYLEARQISASDPDKAEILLTASLLENPTDVEAIQAMARLQFAKGNKELANNLMLESTRLAPANKYIRLDAGQFWADTGQWDKAIESWRQALTTSPQLGKELYPVLLQLTENKETLPLLTPLIENPPEWWDTYTEYLALNAKNLDIVATVAAMRMQSSVPLSIDERRYVVRRMMKDGQWPRAYIAWVNGLDHTQLGYLGSIYDGSFELEPSNEGFGWHITKNRNVSIRKQRTYGGTGDKALQLTFEGEEMIFKHLYQPLYLTLGGHEFTANLKTDRLKSRGGLKWVIRCAGDQKIVLGESPRLLGSSEWREVKFRFEVPNSKECSIGQILRLESTGQRAYDHKLEGDIWFGRLVIRAVRKPPAPVKPEQKAAKKETVKGRK
ncbi:MAG: tetratricopeptide repeat protein [Arenicellales bacterium]